MFVLDTNVLSELMKSRPDAQVAGWVGRQQRKTLFTTVVSKAEILAGIEMMPMGRRRRELETVARNLFEIGLNNRILPFDDAATLAFARTSAARRRAGRTIGVADLVIAAITQKANATIVTRDHYGFELTGIPLVNPRELT